MKLGQLGLRSAWTTYIITTHITSRFGAQVYKINYSYWKWAADSGRLVGADVLLHAYISRIVTGQSPDKHDLCYC